MNLGEAGNDVQREPQHKMNHQPCEKHLLGSRQLVPSRAKHIFVRRYSPGVAKAARHRVPCRLCQRGISRPLVAGRSWNGGARRRRRTWSAPKAIASQNSAKTLVR